MRAGRASQDRLGGSRRWLFSVLRLAFRSFPKCLDRMGRRLLDQGLAVMAMKLGENVKRDPLTSQITSVGPNSR